MYIQGTIYAIPLLIGSTIALTFCFLALQRYRELGAPAFVVAMAAVAMWSFAYAFELMSPTVADKMVWHRIIYANSGIVPAFWLIFLIQHEYGMTSRTKFWTIVLTVEPILYTALTWTNGWLHEWLWHSITLSPNEALPQMVVNRAAGFYLHVAFTYVLVLLSVIFFLRMLRRESSTLSYYQIFLLVLGVLSPIIANTLHVADLRLLPINLTPFSLMTMGAAVGWFAFRFELWDILPAAHDAVFAGIGDGVIVLNLNDIIIDINPAASRLLHVPVQLALRQQINTLATQHHHFAALQRTIATLKKDTVTRSEVALAEQPLRYIEVTVAALRDRRDRLNGQILTLRDVTARRTAEIQLQEERQHLAARVEERTAELSRANAELARAARLKDEFLANMSHELRTPLNTVLGLSEALHECTYGPLVPAQLRALQHVLDAGRHLLALINDILDVSKIEAGKLALEQGPIAVDSLCQASINFISQSAIKKQLEIVVTVDPSVKFIFGDERRLKQILVNLLDNAVKFTPIAGRIGLAVAGEPLDDTVTFIVWDTGIGIAEVDMPELFKPFVQLDSRLARHHEGTGLGLALVRHMVDLHGGSVGVESRVGAGTKFTVALPWRLCTLKDFIIPAEMGAQEELTRPLRLQESFGREQEGSPSRKVYNGNDSLSPPARLLLVEDNETNIQTFTGYLTNHGYQLIVARSGAEALTWLINGQPDLILLDIQMPELDGWEVARRIRGGGNINSSDVPIIALTALAMPGDRERCLAVGMNAYLSKPVSLRRLSEVIATHLQERYLQIN